MRIIIGSLGASYLVPSLLATGSIGPRQELTIWFCGAFLLAGVLIFAAVIRFPARSPVRRVVGNVLDTGTLSLMLWLNGEMAAPLFFVYLLVTFGNGFRYGLPYLAASAALSVVGFTISVSAHDLWRTDPYWTGGILIGLVVLPAYAAILLTTFRRALRRAEAGSEAKSQFLANISHEIRTPLHGILGLNELLLQSGLPEKQRRFAELTRQSASWLLETVNDVLDFSKIEARGFELDSTAFDLKRVVTDVVALHGESIRLKRLAVSCELDDLLPDRLMGDPLRVAQVLNNLVGNAVKFTETGTVVVRVTVMDTTPHTVAVRVEVADTGVGIPVDAQHRIFEPFFQADGSTTRKFTGTGLGLAITKGLVEGMGGTVDVSSTSGEGATFFFTINFGRLSPADQQVSTPVESPSRVAANASRSTVLSARILSVEDNPVNSELVERFLTGFGCEVVTATTGREAVQVRWTSDCDLILMDCQMPDMDGYAAAQAIRAAEAAAGPGARRIPIVALTAHASPRDRERCLAAGMDDYLSKPFRLADLWEVLTRWLPGGVGQAAGSAPDASAHQFELVPSSTPPALANPPAETENVSAPPEPADAPFGRRTTHELNNLLMAVVGHAELCRDSLCEGSDQRQLLENILDAGQRAADLVASERRRALASTPSP